VHKLFRAKIITVLKVHFK